MLRNEISITRDQFSLIINEMSEQEGYYKIDNWVTNERNYLNIIEPLKKNNIQGGTYIGVGPHQNFAFIEAIKPDLAFIVDIRKQMLLQHLVFKIIFEMSRTREIFLSLLLSKPIPKNTKFENNIEIDKIVGFFYKIASKKIMQQETTLKIISLLKKRYGYYLSDEDKRCINKIMKIFCIANLDITYCMKHNYPHRNNLICFAKLLRGVNEKGEQIDIFSSKEKYDFIRKMQLENKIIPIIGDLAGNKALIKLSDFIRTIKREVSGCYVSSVEYWLFKEKRFSSWMENIRHLPINSNSVIMRQNFQKIENRYQFKFRLQDITKFVQNHMCGHYQNYNDLIDTDYLY